MTTPLDPILFISGAGLDPWVWDDVRSELPVESAVAPRPGAGASAALTDYAEAALAGAPPGRFALVAHSAGGVVASQVLRLAPERVTAFLGLSAAVPRPGRSFVGSMPLPNRWVLGTALRLAGTRPPESAIRRGLGAGLDEDMIGRIVAGFTPESRGFYLDASRGHGWAGPTGYVTTKQDRDFPASLQHRFAERLGASWRDELPAGHLSMVQCPAQVTDAIHRFLSVAV